MSKTPQKRCSFVAFRGCLKNVTKTVRNVTLMIRSHVFIVRNVIIVIREHTVITRNVTLMIRKPTLIVRNVTMVIRKHDLGLGLGLVKSQKTQKWAGPQSRRGLGLVEHAKGTVHLDGHGIRNPGCSMA